MFKWLPWNRVRRNDAALDLSTLYQRLQELPPLSGELQAKYEPLRQELLELFQTAEASGVMADFLKLALEQVVAQTQAEFQVLSFKAETIQGVWSANLQARHWAIPLLVNNLGRLLLEEGGANFLEIPVGDARIPDQPKFTITLQKLDGKSPATMLAEARAELAELKTAGAIE